MNNNNTTKEFFQKTEPREMLARSTESSPKFLHEEMHRLDEAVDLANQKENFKVQGFEMPKEFNPFKLDELRNSFNKAPESSTLKPT